MVFLVVPCRRCLLTPFKVTEFQIFSHRTFSKGRQFKSQDANENELEEGAEPCKPLPRPWDASVWVLSGSGWQKQKCNQQSSKGHNIRRKDDLCMFLPFLESTPSTREVQQNEIKEDRNGLSAEQRSFSLRVLTDTRILKPASVSDALVYAGGPGGGGLIGSKGFYLKSNFPHADQRRAQRPYWSQHSLILFLAQIRWQTSLILLAEGGWTNYHLICVFVSHVFYKWGWWQYQFLELLWRLMNEITTITYLCMSRSRAQQMWEATTNFIVIILESRDAASLLWSKKTVESCGKN